MNQQTVYQTVSVQDELPVEGEDILISYDNGQTFPESAAFRETRTCMLAGIGGGNGHFGSGFCTNGSSGCESGLILSDVTYWLKPTAGYFFTPEEFREVLIKAQESACKQLLSDMAKGFLANKGKVEIFSDKAVFQAIGETIQKFPLPDFQTFYNQLTGAGE